MTFDTETDISVVNQENKRDRDDRGNEQRIPRCYQMHPAKNKYPDAFVIRRSSGDFIDVFYLFMSLMYLSLFFLFCSVSSSLREAIRRGILHLRSTRCRIQMPIVEGELTARYAILRRQVQS